MSNKLRPSCKRCGYNPDATSEAEYYKCCTPDYCPFYHAKQKDGSMENIEDKIVRLKNELVVLEERKRNAFLKGTHILNLNNLNDSDAVQDELNKFYKKFRIYIYSTDDDLVYVCSKKKLSVDTVQKIYSHAL